MALFGVWHSFLWDNLYVLRNPFVEKTLPSVLQLTILLILLWSLHDNTRGKIFLKESKLYEEYFVRKGFKNGKFPHSFIYYHEKYMLGGSIKGKILHKYFLIKVFKRGSSWCMTPFCYRTIYMFSVTLL